MKYQVVKPFFDDATGDVLQPGAPFQTPDESHARDLLRAGLIEQKQITAAPFNKDASRQRRNKHA